MPLPHNRNRRNACVCVCVYTHTHTVWAGVRVYWHWYWFVSKFNDNSPAAADTELVARCALRLQLRLRSLQLFAELLERKICLQLHAHLRGTTERRGKKNWTNPRPYPILLFRTLSLRVSLSDCLSVCLRGSTSSKRITTVLYMYAYAYVHMFVYKRLSGPTESINWNSSCTHYMTLFLWIIYLCMLISTSSLLLKCIITTIMDTLQHLKMCEEGWNIVRAGIYYFLWVTPGYRVAVTDCSLSCLLFLYVRAFRIERFWSFQTNKMFSFCFPFLFYFLQLNFHITAGIKRLNTGPEACF